MALTSSEHELLVKTCENMNIAAGTCREVLEMLRNLGNTGVVDIATHNNTPGAHATDPTIAHILDSGSSRVLYLGDRVFAGLGSQPYPITLSCDNTTHKMAFIVFNSKTQGGQALNQNFVRSDIFLTDSSGNMTTFGGYTQSNLFYKSISSLTSYLHDKDDKILQWGIKNTIGRSSARGDTEDITSSPYTSMQFWISDSFTSTVCPFTIDKDGFFPGGANTYSIGSAIRPLNDLFIHNPVTVTSDRREKTGVSTLGSEALSFIKALRPVGYRLVEGRGAVERLNPEDDSPADPIPSEPGSRNHWGLIAQEVQEALVSAGYDPSDCAVWCLADKNDPDSKQALRYEELIAPMIKVIQNQQERIEALERRVA